MASAVLVNVKEVVTCFISLGLLSTDYGGSSRQACTALNYRPSQRRRATAPSPHIPFQFKNSQANRRIANTVGRLEGSEGDLGEAESILTAQALERTAHSSPRRPEGLAGFPSSLGCTVETPSSSQRMLPKSAGRSSTELRKS